MDAILFAGLSLLLSLLTLELYHLFRTKLLWRLRDAPPLISGWLPFIGCAVEFGKGPPVQYIKECRERFGDIFTLHLGGRDMTFLLNSEDFPSFFNKDENVIDFQRATQPFLSRGFGVSADSYFNHHERVLQVVRTRLTPAYLSASYITFLTEHIHEGLDQWIPSGQSEATISLHDKYSGMITRFNQFDGSFELASSEIPHIFLPAFTGAQQYLLDILKKVSADYFAHPDTNNIPGTRDPLLGKMIVEEVFKDELESDDPKKKQESISAGASWLLAILWAAEANTIPMIFWIFTYLLSHDDYMQKVIEEVDEAYLRQEDGKLSFQTLKSLPLLNNAVKETVRLRSAPIILRRVQQNVAIGSYTVPKGNFLCLSPLWAHREPNICPEGDVWNPYRWQTEGGVAKDVRFSSIAFGGGKYRCPGQSFAYLEMLLMVATVLRKFHLSFAEGVQMPPMAMDCLVGVPKPKSDARVVISPRPT